MLHNQTAKKGDFVGAGSATISILINYLYKPALLHNQTVKKGDFVGAGSATISMLVNYLYKPATQPNISVFPRICQFI
ncbi:MAG: hypothetical protein WAN66_29070 [Limnoraphis robusta]|uniref:Uncharacterized protein n=1 Tax=Limnoraphis robusta CS-951 TaxID=1637645 RepID=A0A0F5YDR3_9CYAN|nr:hypothetical protein WN50_16670 [Limnoraphis robusta CS-951]